MADSLTYCGYGSDELIIRCFVGRDIVSMDKYNFEKKPPNVEFIFVDDNPLLGKHEAQVNATFCYPSLGGGILFCDADVAFMRPITHLLEGISNDPLSIFAAMAHYGPASQQPSSTGGVDWNLIAGAVIKADIPSLHELGLEPGKKIPFYPNFGVLGAGRDIFPRLGPEYIAICEEVSELIRDKYFKYQVGIPFFIQKYALNAESIDYRHNYSNNKQFEDKYKYPVESIFALHYLDTSEVRKHQIFMSQEKYLEFISLNLTGADAYLQQRSLKIWGDRIPYLVRADS